jgi:hypothetical protein
VDATDKPWHDGKRMEETKKLVIPDGLREVINMLLDTQRMIQRRNSEQDSLVDVIFSEKRKRTSRRK